jgi:hypothetical protein
MREVPGSILGIPRSPLVGRAANKQEEILCGFITPMKLFVIFSEEVWPHGDKFKQGRRWRYEDSFPESSNG